MLIAQDRASDCTIVLPDEPTAEEAHAAEELAHYLQAATGAELPVVSIGGAPDAKRILLGGAALEVAPDVRQLAGDAFIVRTVGEDTVLAGNPPRGTLYAVFDFLEREVGIRWFNWYGEEFVPDLDRLQIGEIDRLEEPAFVARDIYFHRNATQQQMRDFILRSRVTGPATSNLLSEEGYGGSVHKYGGRGVHTLFTYISPDDHFGEHPEWFSFLSGKRQDKQLCFSNPGLRTAMTDAIREQAAKSEGVRNISISAQDRGGAFCECPECVALSEREDCPGGPLYDYIAEIADEIAPDYPDVYITTLAYRHNQSEKPPANLQMPENVIIIFAPIDANFAESLEHPSNAETLSNIAAWPERTEHLWVWYYTNPYGGGAGLPLGNLGRLAGDMRLFKRTGVEGFFIEHDTGIGQMHVLADLQTWLLAKLMWKPEQDLEALIEDFTDHYYGAAGPKIREYIALLEAETAARALSLRWTTSPGQFRHLTPEFLAQAHAIFDAAEEAVEDDATLLQRVRIARMGLDRATLMTFGGEADKVSAPPQPVVERYRATWQRAIDERIAENRRGAVRPFVDDFLALAEAFREPAPLPPEIADEDPESVIQIGPMVVQQKGDVEVRPDPNAAMGIAATRPITYDRTFTIGAYAWDEKKIITQTEITAEDVPSAGYNVYRVGEGALTGQTSVWITRSWRLNVPIETAYDPENPDREFEIYASLRFEGPGFGQPGDEDRVFFDRIMLVPAE
ncbi:MAG: DUF4838 domain-containing protein [Armatimonadia bacterium]|nr:DUF4838 domain-containing protein [Armatimonadia bacterium]